MRKRAKALDVAIIGGGIAGLSAGVYAQRAGMSAAVYEKNPVAGGECTGWDREGYHIDNCIHWMMGTSGDTGLNRLWRETGAIDGVEIITSDRMYTSELNGESLTLWKDAARTQAEMLALSPEDAEEIEKLMEYVKLSAQVEIPAEKPPELYTPLDLIEMGASMKNALRLFKDFADTDTQDLMERFRHPLLRCLISDFCTKESMGSSFPMAYGNFTGGDGGVPRGGSRAMALRMQKRLEELGGKVYTNAPVQRLNVENGHVQSLTLADGRTITADYYLCACDPDFTFHALLDPSYMDPVLAAVYADPDAYPVYGMFQAAYAVDSPLVPMVGEVILDCGALRSFDWMGERLTVKTYAYEPSFAPMGKQIVQILWGLRAEGYDYWRALYADKAAYAAKKQELADAAMGLIQARFPEYAGKMRLLDAWTPMTYRRYCNAYKGYNQAFTITKRSMKNPYPAAWISGLDNALLTGQWLSPPGGLPGAAIQGKFSILRICKKEGLPTRF